MITLSVLTFVTSYSAMEQEPRSQGNILNDLRKETLTTGFSAGTPGVAGRIEFTTIDDEKPSHSAYPAY